MLPLAHALLTAVHPDLAKLALVTAPPPAPEPFLAAFTTPAETGPVPPPPAAPAPPAVGDRPGAAGTR
jgi:hypothetical protein